MQKFILILLICLSIVETSYSQSMNVSGFEDENFPEMKSVFVLKNDIGDKIQDTDLSNYRIIEGGVEIPDSNIKVNCFGGEEEQELAIVLVIDRSESMEKEYELENGDVYRPIEKVKSSIDTLFSKVDLKGRTKVAIISFSHTSTLTCPFTNDKQELLDSIDNIKFGGPTHYTDPFIKPSSQNKKESVLELLKSSPPELKRASVFFTDSKPDKEPETAKIIDSLNYYNISAYNISFLSDMWDALAQISNETNGKSYIFNNNHGIIIHDLLGRLKNSNYCTLEWLSSMPCHQNDLERDVVIEYTGFDEKITMNRNYTLSENFLPKRTWSEENLNFGNPAVGEEYTVTKNITFNIENIDFEFNDIIVFPNDQGFRINSIKYNNKDLLKADTVREGAEIQVELSFTQYEERKGRVSQLIIYGRSCQYSTLLNAGESEFISINSDTVDFGEVEIKPINIFGTRIMLSNAIEEDQIITTKLFNNEDDAFQISKFKNTLVEKEKNEILKINFNPKNEKKYNSILRISNEYNEVEDIVLTGVGKRITNVNISNNINDRIKISPNPIINDLLQIKKPREINNFTLTIHSLEGKVIYNKDFTSIYDEIFKIKLPEIQSGMYIISIKTTGNVYTHSILIL